MTPDTPAEPLAQQALNAAKAVLDRVYLEVQLEDGNPAWGLINARRLVDAALAQASALPAAQQPAAAIERELDRIRAEQAAAVMPLIGPLCDAWDGMDNDTKATVREEAPDLAAALRRIGRAMEADAPAHQGRSMTPDTPAPAELLPCPFCGYEAVAGEIGEPTDPNCGGHFIQCTNHACGASTNLRFACGEDPLPLLAEQWNRRATPPAAEPLSDALVIAARLALEDLETATSFTSKKSRDRHARTVRVLRAALATNPASPPQQRTQSSV